MHKKIIFFFVLVGFIAMPSTQAVITVFTEDDTEWYGPNHLPPDKNIIRARSDGNPFPRQLFNGINYSVCWNYHEDADPYLPKLINSYNRVSEEIK